jgi:hypothetical protein
MPLGRTADLQFIAALAAMSEANLALRAGSVAAPAIGRAVRCLEELADCPALAPPLQRLCDALSAQWSTVLRELPDSARRPAPDRVAEVIPLLRARSRKKAAG